MTTICRAGGTTTTQTATNTTVGGTVTFDVDHVVDAGADGILGTADDNLGLGQFTDTTGYHRKDEAKAKKTLAQALDLLAPLLCWPRRLICETNSLKRSSIR